ncbi:hypothetical protein ACYSNV_04795 [Myroides sp. LJL119]
MRKIGLFVIMVGLCLQVGCSGKKHTHRITGFEKQIDSHLVYKEQGDSTLIKAFYQKSLELPALQNNSDIIIVNPKNSSLSTLK